MAHSTIKRLKERVNNTRSSSPAYVIEHGKLRRQQGKKLSATLLSPVGKIREPRAASEVAKSVYMNQFTPRYYKLMADLCRATNLREYLGILERISICARDVGYLNLNCLPLFPQAEKVLRAHA